MNNIFIDLIFLVALVLIANKIRHTWKMLFPNGFCEWWGDRNQDNKISPPPED